METQTSQTLSPKTKSRLDAFLSENLSLSRKESKAVIEGGFCKVGQAVRLKPSFEVLEGDFVEVFDYSSIFERRVAKTELVPTIIYEDEAILALSKPSGLTVHEGSGVREETLVDYLKNAGFTLAQIAGEGREGIVHRLDKETSGLMVAAKTNEAANGLKEQFGDKSAGRYYLAIIEPPLKEDVTVEAKIGRNPKNRVAMRVMADGKEAKSAFKKIALSDNGKFELIAAKLFSGRTHQIRAHLAHIGRRIVGDDLYGFNAQSAKIEANRVMLHAAVLYFYHPVKAEKITFFDKPPEDFTALFERFFTKENTVEIFSREFILSLFGGAN